jgi:hypothetical protein
LRRKCSEVIIAEGDSHLGQWQSAPMPAADKFTHMVTGKKQVVPIQMLANQRKR